MQRTLEPRDVGRNRPRWYLRNWRGGDAASDNTLMGGCMGSRRRTRRARIEIFRAAIGAVITGAVRALVAWLLEHDH
jgi:hypothetical protein